MHKLLPLEANRNAIERWSMKPEPTDFSVCYLWSQSATRSSRHLQPQLFTLGRIVETKGNAQARALDLR